MAIEQSKYLRVRVMGESVTTPYDSKIALMQTHSPIKVTDNVKTVYEAFPFFSLGSIDTGLLFKIDLEYFLNNSTVGQYLDYKIRLYPTLNTGFNVKFTHVLVGTNHYLGMDFKAVNNGSVWGNSLTPPGSYYSNDEKQKNQYCITDKNGKYRFIPCLVNVGEAGYMWGYVCEWYGSLLTERESGIVVSNYPNMPPYISVETVAEEVSNYPYEDDTTEDTGNGTLDDSSDDVEEPDDELTDGINTVLNSGGLLTTYKLSLAQLQLVGSSLWDSNIVTQIKTFFNNPMDAIVSLQMLPFNVTSEANRTMKIGGVTLTGVNGGVVKSNQQVISCGTVDLEPYWGNFLDINNTKISIFLPFVGIHDINPNYIQGGSLTVTYKVDILTGSFICWLKYTKDGHSNILQRFTGCMSLQLPLTANTHTGTVSALSTVARTVGSAVLAGGAVMAGGAGAVGAGLVSAGALKAGAVGTGLVAGFGGASSAVSQALRHDYSDKGNYNMNVGFMDNRTPYLIIERPKSVMPTGYRSQLGFPSFASAVLASCHGFTKIASWQPTLTGVSAEEVDQITRQLKTGVILP